MLTLILWFWIILFVLCILRGIVSCFENELVYKYKYVPEPPPMYSKEDTEDFDSFNTFSWKPKASAKVCLQTCKARLKGNKQ